MFKRIKFSSVFGIAWVAAASACLLVSCAPDFAHAQPINPAQPATGVPVAGTGINVVGQTVSVIYGTTAGTALQGNSSITVANGGTGLSNPTAFNVPITNGSSAFSLVPMGASGTILASNGVSANPSFQTPASLLTTLFASPPPIGSTAANTGAFTNLSATGTSTLANLSASGTVSGTGFTNLLANGAIVQKIADVAALRLLASCIPGQVYQTQTYRSATFDARSAGAYYCNSADTSTADNGGTIIATAGAGYRLYLLYDGVVNVKQFGAYGDNSHDDSTAFNNAQNVGVMMYAPTGTYLLNATFTKKFNLVGDGSIYTVLKPFSIGTAAITYNPTSAGPFWTYHSTVRNVGFTTSSTAKTGVGFTFGATTQAAYVAGMEYANNVDFYNVQFIALQKGVQFPFGNIGTSFYECSFDSNYYGVYALDNRNYPSVGGSTAMHAGNKYFYGGHFGSNTVGLYVSNQTSGFGGVWTRGTIFETNNVAQYVYASGQSQGYITFEDIWNEQNGQYQGAGNVNIDVWAGTVVTPTAYAPHATVFDGPAAANASYAFKGGMVGDINLNAPNTIVTIDNASVENTSSFGQYPGVVGGANSRIEMSNVTTSGGVPMTARTYVEKGFNPAVFNVTSGNNFSRVMLVPHRYNKLAGSYGGSGTVVNLTTASNLGNGSFSVTAGTTADGVIYGTANTYSAPFTAGSQFVALIAGTQSISAGSYCAVTFDVKVTGGTPTFASHDRAGNSIFDNVAIPENNVWYTMAGIGYFPNAVGTFYGVDISSPTGVTATFLLSAYQLRCFGTLTEAKHFLDSGVYVGP